MSDYPFVPKSNARLLPGEFWSIPLSDGRFGCGRVIDARPEQADGGRTWFLGAILDWVGDAPPTAESITAARPLEVGLAHVEVIGEDGVGILGNRSLEADAIIPPDSPVLVYWGAGGPKQRLERRFVTGEPPQRYELRDVESPLTPEMLAPSAAPRGTIQFSKLLSDNDIPRLAEWLTAHPNFALRAYGSYDGSIRDVEFLRYFPALRRFYVDAIYGLSSIDGLRHLPDDMLDLGLGATKKSLDLSILARFRDLADLSLEAQTKGIEVVSTLTGLRDLTLRSITLPDLSLLRPLTRLALLDIKLGGTRDLELLPEIGQVRYLELWLIRGLTDISAVGRMPHLQALFLQALKGVEALPDFSAAPNLRRLHLETMKGLRDVSRLATAKSLEELVVVDMTHLQPEDFESVAGSPSLKRASVTLGSRRKNDAVEKLLGVPTVENYNWRSDLGA